MKKIFDKLKTVSPGTIVRTLCLVLALANQLLTALGKSPLPITDDEVAQVVSFGITAATALAAWWKNNSFTEAAVMADGVMHDLHKLKCAGKECACVRVESKVKGAGKMGRAAWSERQALYSKKQASCSKWIQ